MTRNSDLDEIQSAVLRSRADFVRVIKSIMRTPPVIAVYVSVMLFSMFFVVVPPYESFANLTRVIMHVIWAGINFVVPYFILGRLLYFAASRNISFYAVAVALFFVLNSLQSFAGYFLVVATPSIPDTLNQIGLTTCFNAAGLLFLFVLLKDKVGPKFSSNPETLPWFWSTQGETNQLLQEIPEALRGQIQYIRSANQYITVTTDKGDALLRMTLSAAIEHLPPDGGWRIHRSVWLSKSVARRVFFESGNPRVETTDGATLPVSRAMVDELKTHLNTRKE